MREAMKSMRTESNMMYACVFVVMRSRLENLNLSRSLPHASHVSASVLGYAMLGYSMLSCAMLGPSATLYATRCETDSMLYGVEQTAANMGFSESCLARRAAHLAVALLLY